MTILIVAIILIVAVVQRWSRQNALEGVEFYYETARLMAAPGEHIELVTTLINRSGRFIPYVQVEQTLPAHASVHAAGAVVKSDIFERDIKHVSKVYLMPRSKLTRRMPISIPERGWYTLPGAELRGGDFLGLRENSEKTQIYNEVVIYPKEAPGEYIENLMGGFLGDISVRRFIIEDPVLTVGFREYTGREPMKAISWPQSARTGRIMVKSFDYTTEPSVSVLLNVELKGDRAYNDRERLIEGCYRIAHTVCRMLEDKGVKYDFYTNALASGAFMDWSYIGEGLGQRHFLTILEGLGRASHTETESFEVLAGRAVNKKTGIRSLVVITPGSSADARRILGGRDDSQTVIISSGEAQL